MNCVNHETRNGVNTCNKCGYWLCEDCSIDIDGRIVCKDCVAELLNSDINRSYGSAGHGRRYARAEYADERRYTRPGYAEDERVRHERYRRYEHTEGHYEGSRRRISRFWLLVFSCVPGVNYMFMGLIKRGIYALSTFLLTVYLGASLDSPLMAMAAIVLFTVSVFDGFKVRRMLINGEYVEDGFSGITNILYRHRIPVCILITLLIASSVFSRPYYFVNRFIYTDVGSVLIFILIAAIIYFFIKPACKTKKRSDTDYIDKRQQ